MARVVLLQSPVCSLAQADGLFGPGGEFRPLPDAPLRPLEEMFRVRVIGFLRGRGLLPEGRARMLLNRLETGGCRL